jgi:hypothetical protein
MVTGFDLPNRAAADQRIGAGKKEVPAQLPVP